MACVLFSRPDHDVILAYLFYYSKELVSVSKEEGHKTINKEKENANKKVLLNIIKKQKPDFIMFNGHGNPEEVCGHRNEVIVSKRDNANVLKGCITYSLSCSSALELGPEAVKNGAKAFIGYEFDFALGKDPDSEAVPSKDKIAKLFLEPSNILVKYLLKRGSIEEAINKARIKMKENIDYLNITNDFLEAPYYAPFLYGNYIGLNAHGDDKLKLS